MTKQKQTLDATLAEILADPVLPRIRTLENELQVLASKIASGPRMTALKRKALQQLYRKYNLLQNEIRSHQHRILSFITSKTPSSAKLQVQAVLKANRSNPNHRVAVLSNNGTNIYYPSDLASKEILWDRDLPTYVHAQSKVHALAKAAAKDVTLIFKN